MRYRSTILIFLALAACTTTPKIKTAHAPVGNVVYFSKLSTHISPAAAAVINQIAAEANSPPGQAVEIVGPSTRVAPGYDPSLAGARFVAVEHALAAAGVPEKNISRSPLAYFPANPDAPKAQSFELRLLLHQRLKPLDGQRKSTSRGHER